METSAVKEENVAELARANSELLDSRDQTPRDQVDVHMETGDAKYNSGEYQQAIDAYKKAIEVNCQDAKLKSTLYTKKALSYFQLGNYQETLHDAKTAKEVDSSNMEAIIIGTKTLLELQDYEQALSWCDEGLLFDNANKKLTELRARLLHKERTSQGLEGITPKETSDGTTKQNKEIKRLEAILRKCQQTGDKSGEGRAYRKLGKAYSNTGQLRRALETYSTGLEIAKEMGNIEGQVVACSGLANAYHDLGELEKALDFNTQSLVLVVRLKDKEGEGRVCFNLANTHCGLCNYKQATEYYRRSIDVFKIIADKDGEEAAYSSLGVMYFKVGRFNKAIECHKVSLDIAKQTSNKNAEERAYCNLGVVHRSKGDFKQALHYLHSNLELVKESRNKAKECDAYNNLGDVYHSLCNYNEAINYRQQSLESAKELGDRPAEGRAYSGLGIAYDCLGDVPKALEYQSRSLEIAIELNDKEGQQRAYGNLGIAHKHLGDIKQAVECYNHFLRIAKETGNKAAEGRAYANLGIAYRTLGNIEQAIKYGKMHLEFAKGVGDKAGEGNAYSNLGIAYRHLNDLKNALECHQRHLDIAKKIGSRVSEGRAYCNLGNVYSSLGNVDKAIECYGFRLDISKEVGNRAGEGLAYGNLGDACYLLGDYKQGLEYGKLYLTIAREVGDKTAEARANFNCGRASEAQGCIENAIGFYRDSVNGFDKLRSLLQREDEWKISLRNQYQEAYTALWSLLLKQERILEALFAAEKGRAQALEDLLKYQYGIVGDVADVDQFSFSDVNVTESTVVYVALEEDFINTWVMKKGTSVRFKRTEMDSQYFKVHGFSDLRTLIDGTINEVGSTASIRCEDRSLDAEERDEGSPDELGNPSVSEGNSYPNNKGEVAEAKLTSHSQCDALLNVLHNLTIAPIEDLIIDNDLIIIPDGPLFLAPFAAFLSSGARFLFESYRFRVLPSLLSLQLILTSQPGYHKSSGALIVGDPDVERIVKKNGRKTVKLLRPLPSARKEAEMIARILDTTPLTGEKATKEEVLLRLNTVAMIHIAAHGNSTTGEIALAPKPLPNSKIPERDDYLLSMAEVLNVGLRARLVVLSCCHSGRGQIKAEGVVGIARAFLGAGARSVLVSLWAIDDDATLEFMRNFYQQLTKGKLASEALNESMKSLKESQKYNALKYWAPFVLIGDDVTLSVGGIDEAGDVKASEDETRVIRDEE